MESLTHETDDSDSESDEARLLFSQVDSDVDDYLNVDKQVLTSQTHSDEDVATALRPPAEEQLLPADEEKYDESPPAVSGKVAQEAVLKFEDFFCRKIMINNLIFRKCT